MGISSLVPAGVYTSEILDTSEIPRRLLLGGGWLERFCSLVCATSVLYLRDF